MSDQRILYMPHGLELPTAWRGRLHDVAPTLSRILARADRPSLEKVAPALAIPAGPLAARGLELSDERQRYCLLTPMVAQMGMQTGEMLHCRLSERDAATLHRALEEHLEPYLVRCLGGWGWLLGSEQPIAEDTAAPAALSGRDLRGAVPSGGTGALMTELQMLVHTQQLADVSGLLVLWPWGGGPAQGPELDRPMGDGQGALSNAFHAGAPEVDGNLLLEGPWEAAARGDLDAWFERMDLVETWARCAWQELSAGRLQRIVVGAGHSAAWSLHSRTRLRFWRRAGLERQVTWRG